jgi:hypothetical protein
MPCGLLGDIVDDFGAAGSLEDAVRTSVIYMCYLSIGAFVVSYLQVQMLLPSSHPLPSCILIGMD